MPAPSSGSDRVARQVWTTHYATPSGFRYMPSEELVRFCGRRRGSLGRVLEVGCGNGANLWYLAEQGSLAVGLDLCDEAIQAAETLCVQRQAVAVLVLASAFEIPFADAYFDTVVDVMVSQHVPWVEHERLYREYRRVLRPGGLGFVYHLVGGTTDSRADQYDHPNGISLFPAAGMTCVPPAELLASRFEAAGFQQVERRGMDRTYPDGSRACYAVIEGTAQ